MVRGGRTSLGDDQPPRDFAQVTPPRAQMLDHSFTLQAVMELQKSLAELGAKTDRLITDVTTQGEKGYGHYSAAHAWRPALAHPHVACCPP